LDIFKYLNTVYLLLREKKLSTKLKRKRAINQTNAAAKWRSKRIKLQLEEQTRKDIIMRQPKVNIYRLCFEIKNLNTFRFFLLLC
jgi:hypothetical protein